MRKPKGKSGMDTNNDINNALNEGKQNKQKINIKKLRRRATLTPPKDRGKHMCSGRVGSSHFLHVYKVVIEYK